MHGHDPSPETAGRPCPAGCQGMGKEGLLKVRALLQEGGLVARRRPPTRSVGKPCVRTQGPGPQMRRSSLQMDALLKQERIHLQSVDNDPQSSVCSRYSITASHTPMAHHGKATSCDQGVPSRHTFAPSRQVDDGETPECGSRIRLGVASAFFQDDNSVMSDFRGVIDRLPRDEFEVYVIRFVGEARGVFIPYTGLEKDEVLTFDKRQPSWLDSARAQIGALKLDVLLFLDLTMSQMATTLAMSRLARIQATSHGHPTTSGITACRITHLLGSCGAAECAEHYTERLALPRERGHQYLAHRALNGTSSRWHAVQPPCEKISSDVPSDGHYLCCRNRSRQPNSTGCKGDLDLDPHASCCTTWRVLLLDHSIVHAFARRGLT